MKNKKAVIITSAITTILILSVVPIHNAFAVTSVLAPGGVGAATCAGLGSFPTWDGFKCTTLFGVTWGDGGGEDELNIKPGATLFILGGCAELVNLKIQDISFDEKIGHVRQAKGRKDRIFNIPDEI